MHACIIYLNNESLWVSENISLRLWNQLAFVFTLFVKTVNGVFEVLKLKVLQQTQKKENV